MCGIAGLIDLNLGREKLVDVSRRMGDSLVHRGPDSGGIWFDGEVGIGLSHRRLSIIDLSIDGNQPMRSASGRYVIVLNGEIYNYKVLRADLEKDGCAFRGRSDTEVLLEAISRWGIHRAIQQAVGMFALALWDRTEKRLWLARDRFGEKPLYWTASSSRFVFGSELKALRALGDPSPRIDRSSLALFMRYNYVPGPRTIFEGVQKLPPATIMSVQRRDGALVVSQPEKYWSVDNAWTSAQANTFPGTFDDAVDELDVLLRRTIRQQMMSDVPLGAFLSGGVDSSTIVAVMQQESTRPVKTFTIGFRESNFDEAIYAKQVARHLGTEHTELYVSPEEALKVIPLLPEIYDEPFADSSQVPTYLVSAMAQRHVTVALTGDGGDEVFGGYNRYIWARDIWKWLRVASPTVRKGFGSAVRAIPVGLLNAIGRTISPMLPQGMRYASPGDKLHKFMEVCEAKDAESLYRRLQSHWTEPNSVVLGANEPAPNYRSQDEPITVDGFIDWMMKVDAVTYLPDDILVKVDRASMAVSLETRVPFLDHQLYEFAVRLPAHFRMCGRQGKQVLRAVLRKSVPTNLIDRPKTGFGVPIDSWLRGPLRDWAATLLSEQRLRDDGYFDPAPIRKYWNQHQAGTHARHYLLWDVLMFQAWNESVRAASMPRRRSQVDWVIAE